MLTDTAIKKAKPKDKAYKLGDFGGLYLYVMPSGYRSWRMKFRFGGKEKRLVFGSYPDTTLIQARAMRESAAKLLRDGIDPSVHKIQQAAAQLAPVGAGFGLPKEAADMVRRMMRKGSLPDDEITRRKVNEEETAAMLRTLSSEDLAAFRAGDESAFAKALDSLRRSVDLHNADLPGGQNPTLQG